MTIGCYYMDTGDTSFEKLSYNVTDKEEVKVNGRDGVYLKTAMDAYNQSLYVTYPEEHLVLEMLVSSDVSKEEALKIAQGVTVTPTEETSGDDVMLCYNWSRYLETEKENALAGGIGRCHGSELFRKAVGESKERRYRYGHGA